MIKRVFTIIKEDLVFFPPTLSLIRALCDLNIQVIHLGNYSDSIQRQDLESKGVKFVELIKYNKSDTLITKLIKQKKFKKKVKDYELWEVGDVQQDGTVLLLATEKKTGKWKNFYAKVIL